MIESLLIHPNWHAFVIHIPMGLLTIGVLIELFSFLWRRSSLRLAARWMILIGSLSMLPAAMTGIYALNDAVVKNVPRAAEHWNDKLNNSTLTPEAFDALTKHVRLQVLATIIFLTVTLVWLGCCDKWRKRLYGPFLALLVIGLAVASYGGFQGGEAVYQYRVAVDQPMAGDLSAAVAGIGAHGHAGVESSGAFGDKVLSFLAPEQLHITLAGITFALALVSLALSARVITSTHREQETLGAVNDADTAGPVALAADGGNTAAEVVPSGRFWVLALISALLTAIGGHVILGIHTGKWALADTLHIIAGGPRTLVHGINGAAIIVLIVLLGLASRWARQKKIVLLVMGILLVLAISLQVWLGTLLVLDSHAGPLTGFTQVEIVVDMVNPAAVESGEADAARAAQVAAQQEAAEEAARKEAEAKQAAAKAEAVKKAEAEKAKQEQAAKEAVQKAAAAREAEAQNQAQEKMVTAEVKVEPAPKVEAAPKPADQAEAAPAK